jgi:cell division protein FtsN
VLAISGLVSLAWYAQETSREEQAGGTEVPLITAEGGEIKTRPEEPGGKQFPHQDKQVYRIINPSQSEPEGKVHLAPQPDQPKVMPREEAVAELQRRVEEKEPEKVVEPVKQEAVPVVKTPVSEPVKKSEPVTVVTPVKMPEPQKPVAPVKQGAIALQLGAFRSAEEANGQWGKIAAKHPSVVRGYSHSVVKADLGAKGIYYRLRLNGFENTAAANDTCAKLKAQGQACFTVK